MSPTATPPALAAVMTARISRTHQLKAHLAPTEWRELQRFAALAGTRPSTLAAALIAGGLARLAAEEADRSLALEAA